MLSILGGLWKGKRLEVPYSKNIRPSSSKIRGAIFDIITSIRLKEGKDTSLANLRCLDIFAGSGALGFEALSRGADHCTFVEKRKAHSQIILKNAKSLACEDQISSISAPAESWLKQKKWEIPFDLIFSDPPYLEWKPNDLEELLELFVRHPLLAKDGLLFLEYNPKWQNILVPEQLECKSQRILGPAALSVFTLRL